MKKYFYRLGHQPRLGLAELGFLQLEAEIDSRFLAESWLLSDKLLDVRRSGSLVFGGEILSKIEAGENLLTKIEQILKSLPEQFPERNWKKLGLSLPLRVEKNELLNLSKNCGVKKFNHISVLPNYGHWKQCKNWLVGFYLNKELYLGLIESYFDQETWARLDQSLPQQDMKRGLMNLKLARTLLNFSAKKVVWDPFCGAGRIAVAGLDLKEQFLLSDRDSVCLPEAAANLQFAQEFWQRRGQDSAVVTPPFPLDAQQMALPHDLTLDTKNLAIVTEGYLGTNFHSAPHLAQINREWQQLEKIWQNTLLQAHKLGVEEIIFCLPFYQINKQKMLPNFLEKILQKTNYKYVFLGKEKHLLYSRENSLVGHMILKVSNQKTV